MRNFEDEKAMYLKVVSLQDEIKETLQNYIEKENITVQNYSERLYNQFNKVAESIFNELSDGGSENIGYLIEHMENDTGDPQLIAAFVRAYITDQIFSEVVGYEELESSIRSN